jgi:DNA polymerase-1
MLPTTDPRLFDLDLLVEGEARPRDGPRTRTGGGGRRRRPGPMLLAVDGNGLAHRAFHAVGGEEAPAGAAVERVVAMLARVAAGLHPTACVIGFDDPQRSLRRERCPHYKSARPPKPATLVALLAELPALLRRLGLCVAEPPGLEADDVLGSAAALARRRQVPATLLTGDQDAFALVSPTVRVCLLLAGGRVEQVTPSWLRARYGVLPPQYADFAALRGDASDCLPGVRGIGAVTAARLLGAYPDVAAALEDLPGVARLLGPAVAEALTTQRAVYRQNREVMAIRTDVALDVAACNRRLERQRVAAVLAEHGLEELTDRLLAGFALLGRAAWRRSPQAEAGTGAPP